MEGVMKPVSYGFKKPAGGLPVDGLSRRRVCEIVDGWRGCHVMVVGDMMLDRFLNVKLKGYDSKDGSPVYVGLDDDMGRGEIWKVDSLGGAGNVCVNVRYLCDGRVFFSGVVGRDKYGIRVQELCSEDVTKGRLYFDDRPWFRTTVREYVVCQEDCTVEDEDGGMGVEHRDRTLMRYDYDSGDVSDDLGREESRFQLSLTRGLLDAERLDGIILSDYGMGVVNRRSVEKVAKFMTMKEGRDVCVVIDTRASDLSKYDRFFALGREVSDRVVLVGSADWLIEKQKMAIYGEDEDLAQNVLSGFVHGVRERFHFDGVYLTRGGMPGFLSTRERSNETEMVWAYDVEVKNAVGAGDASTAGFALSYFRGGDIVESSKVAQMCGAISASYSGVSFVTAEMLKAWAHEVLVY